MVTTPVVASTENCLVTWIPSAAEVSLAMATLVPQIEAAYTPGSSSAGGGQFHTLCGLGQKVEPQLLFWPLGEVTMFLPPSETVTMRPPLAASTANTVSPAVKV